MVAGRNLVAFAAAIAGSGVADPIKFFGPEEANHYYLQPREVTVTVTENYCPPGAPYVPLVETSATVPPAAGPPSTTAMSMTPEAPVIPPGGGVVPVPVATSLHGVPVPVTPGYPATEVVPPVPTTTSRSVTSPISVTSVATTVSTASVSSRPTSSVATTVYPSTTTQATGDAALTSANIGLLVLVAMTALHQVI